MKGISKEKLLIVLYKIFFVGLLLQFFAYNIVTFKIGLQNNFTEAFWLRKEIMVVIWTLFACYYIWQHKVRRSKNAIRYITLIFVALMVYALLDTLFKGISISRFIKAWKYDFIGFMIFIATYYLSHYITPQKATTFLTWTMRTMKVLLILALFRYTILMLKPGVLKLFGYDRLSIEGNIGQRPPAVYRTREFEWYPRNQFIFERPISRWFFLTAFFPLFFVYYLQRRSMKKTWFWRAVFGLNVIFTYSRAAWGSRIIELGILWIITYRKQMRFFLKQFLLPAVLILLAVARIAKDQVIHREFSNTWHIQLLVQGWNYFASHPILGMWAWSVWPASHRAEGLNFNPENQFLQIAIEFWIIGFIIWMTIYLRLHKIGYDVIRTQWKNKKISIESRYLIAFSIGMLWLSISWLVLHSFTDRMIIYPFMLVWGIIYYIFQQPHSESIPKK